MPLKISISSGSSVKLPGFPLENVQVKASKVQNSIYHNSYVPPIEALKMTIMIMIMKRRRWKRRTTALSFDNGHERPLCLTTERGLCVFPLVFNNLPMPPSQLLPTMTSLSPLSPVSPDYSPWDPVFPIISWRAVPSYQPLLLLSTP